MRSLAICLILCGLVPTSLGCSCWFPYGCLEYWKLQICNAIKSDYMFYIKAKIIGPRTEVNPGEMFSDVYYELKYMTDLKPGAPKMQNVDTTKLYTASDGALCGVSFQTIGEDYTYILTGYISGKKLYIGLCDFKRIWSGPDLYTTLKPDEKQFINNPECTAVSGPWY